MNIRKQLFFLLIFIIFSDAIKANFNVDSGFAPVVELNSTVARPIYDHAVQTDGKIIIGGNFTVINGSLRRNFARVNADGSIDSTFNTGSGANGQVEAVAVQTDGKIILAGLFSAYNGTARNRLARINPNGSLDTSFVPEVNGQIQTIVIQPDNKILLGGNFTNINGTTIRRVARLNPDGSLDTTFNPGQGANSNVRSIAVQTDGKILLGGDFFLFNDTANRYFLRLNADGSIDGSFNLGTGAGNSVYSIKLQTDGKIVISGIFDTFNNIERNNFARLNADGSLDTSLNSPFAQSTILGKFDIQPDGKLIVLGDFAMLENQTRSGLVRLNPNGTVDASFGGSGFDNNSRANAVSVLPDGKILASGAVNGYVGNPAISIAKINGDGSFDNTFQFRTGNLGTVEAIKIQPDGKTLIGGRFGFINGMPRNGIARFQADGSLDPTFNSIPGILTGRINGIALQTDGKIIIVGSFLSYNGVPHQGVARLNADGSLDTSFNTGALNSTDSEIDDVAVTTNGKIIISGFFGSIGGVQRVGLAQLNTDGSLDTSFVPLLTNFGRVSALVLQPDGKIVIGGVFTSYSGTSRNGIARLNADATLDASFNPGSGTGNFGLFDMALQPDGKIVIGGSLFTYNGTPRNGVARVNSNGSLDSSFDPGTGSVGLVRTVGVDSRGRILVGGDLTQFNGVSVGQVVRLNANGSLNTTFGAGSSSTVYAFGFQANKTLIGGFIGLFDNIPVGGLVRVTDSVSAIDFDGDRKTDISIFRPVGGSGSGEWWYLRSSDSQNRAFQFGSASDKIVPADFTGDGKTDIAFWRPSLGQWFVLRSEDSSFYSFPFGANGDIPATADYDGDGKADAAVFRSSNATWFIQRSSDNGTTIISFGTSTDQPVPADYDGDGKADIAIFRPVGATGAEWWYLRSSDGANRAFQFGSANDKAVPGDYTGDGKTDIAFWRGATGEWFILRSEDSSFYSFPFGANGDVPAPGDYDGDGRFDATVFRPSSNTWFSQRSSSGTLILNFGASGDIPVPNAFVRP